MNSKNLLLHFVSLFYPNLCLICGENLNKSEHQICLKCLHEIPRTNFHTHPNNPVEKRFWGKVDVWRATSFFFFTKGSPFQKLIHELKYHDNKEIGVIMGRYAAVDLMENDIFSSIDCIVPIPLHPKKFAKRGYNQSEMIGKGLSEILQVPQDYYNLRRLKANDTQTKKSVFDRYTNTAGIFNVVDVEKFSGKHILLVDDVLTTGSTIEAAVHELKKCKDVKVSVFTLAIA
ncbi:MAG: amidophosphoribosyltransferase [Porphyromonadaceae bacterium CG2_30_38_12]|nr:MAG: amidophosphoribosyltransferase [Porphyromonadaceae bacterium CG2_30_38_12]